MAGRRNHYNIAFFFHGCRWGYSRPRFSHRARHSIIPGGQYAMLRLRRELCALYSPRDSGTRRPNRVLSCCDNHNIFYSSRSYIAPSDKWRRRTIREECLRRRPRPATGPRPAVILCCAFCARTTTTTRAYSSVSIHFAQNASVAKSRTAKLTVLCAGKLYLVYIYIYILVLGKFLLKKN